MNGEGMKPDFKKMALVMSVNCVRNTIIEDYHAGVAPLSKSGDYSDVKVVTPFGEIPWNEVSRISDREMMAFNKEVVNRIYTFLLYRFSTEKSEYKEVFQELMNLAYPDGWDAPEIDKGFKNALNNVLGKFGSRLKIRL